MTTTYWWRDDDAGRDDPKLERLLDLAARHERPLTVAVVPEWLEPATVERLLGSPWATVIQHGVAHTDWGGPDDKKIELGGTVDRGWLADRLVAGRERLEAAFGDRFVPALAPPWNNIATDVAARLPSLGFCGLSCDPGPPGVVPLRRVDVHVDAVAWHEGTRSKGAAELEAELAAARSEVGEEPVGLLTHHLVVSEPGWRDLDQVLRLGHDDLSVVWATARQLFGEP
jgi:peptidoglycan/xylan/chitin deacetylase (PgdA/CDA1 family)